MDLVAAARSLQQAQRTGDVDALDRLLHPDVVAIGAGGKTYSKDGSTDGVR